MVYSGLTSPIQDNSTKPRLVVQDARNLDIALHHPLSIAPPDWEAAQTRQARQAFEQKDYTKALEILARLSESSQHTLSILTLQAEIYTALEEDEQALNKYRYILEHSNDFNEIVPLDKLRMQGLTHMNMGWNLQRMQRLEDALHHYSEAIEYLERLRSLKTESIFTSLMVAYQQRSQVHRQLGFQEQALKDLQHSVVFQQELVERDVWENMVKDWLEIAETQIQQQNYAAAQKSLESARADWIKLSLDEAEVLLTPLQLLEIKLASARGNHEEALVGYDVLIQRFQKDLKGVYYRLLKIELLFSHKVEEAVAACEELSPALLSWENDAERELLTLPLLAAAELCDIHAQETLALSFYQFALRFASQHKSAHWLEACAGRARLLEQTGDLRRAIGAYRDLLRHMENHNLPETGPFLLRLALCYQQVGKTEDALKQFEAVLQSPAETEIHPEHLHIRARYFRAFLHALDREDLPAARTDFEDIEMLLPGYAAYDLACIATRQEQWDQAFAYLIGHLESTYALSREDILADTDLEVLRADPRWQAQVDPLMP